jgi:hypothetical protein
MMLNTAIPPLATRCKAGRDFKEESQDMKTRNLPIALCSALLALAAAPACAQNFLMTSDGVTMSNNPAVVSLGYTASGDFLANIITYSQAQLSAFDVIWVNPIPDHAALTTGTAAGGALEQYVAGGGTLVLNLASGGNMPAVGPGGVGYVHGGSGSSFHNSETFTTPLHPYLTGAGYGGTALTPADFNNWSFTDHGHLSGLPLGATTVLSNTDGPSFAQYTYGSGTVLVNTLTYGWGGYGAQGAPRDNLFKYAAFVAVTPAVPEPGIVALGAGAACFGLAALRRGRRAAKRSA